LVDQQNRDISKICSYDQPCKPLHIAGQSCPNNFVCVVEDKYGTATCTALYAPDGGSGLRENAPCKYANECTDGLMCIDFGDGGACRLLCLTAGTTYDAGPLDGAPGYGGCPDAEACTEGLTNFPSWLSLCAR
jgi:hypothetical protein